MHQPYCKKHALLDTLQMWHDVEHFCFPTHNSCLVTNTFSEVNHPNVPTQMSQPNKPSEQNQPATGVGRKASTGNEMEVAKEGDGGKKLGFGMGGGGAVGAVHGKNVTFLCSMGQCWLGTGVVVGRPQE